MTRASMVTTLSALIVLSHVAAASASTWVLATCADDPEVDLCDRGCPDDPELDLCDPLVLACVDDPEVDLCDDPPGTCPDDPDVDLCDPEVLSCLDDPDVDLCDPEVLSCLDDPDVDLCDPEVLSCLDDPEVDLCAPTPAAIPTSAPAPVPTSVPTSAPPRPTPSPTPAPTFPAGTTLSIAQSMTFSSSGTSSEVANAVLEHLAAHMDVPKSACTVSVAEVPARRLTESVPVAAFLLPLGRRLSSSTQWKADYEVQLDDPQKANEVLAKASTMSGDPSAFAASMASKFQELGLTMDVGSLTVQPPAMSAAEEEQSASITTPPPSSVAEEGDAQASTDALVIILVLALVAVIGCVCAGFWLHRFRQMGHRKKQDQQDEGQAPAADPESAAGVSGEQQADGNDGVVM